MLYLAVQSVQGPIGIIGLCDENMVRMRAGMPLDIDVKKLTPPGTRVNRILVHLAHTYEDVVDDMKKGGLPVNDELYTRAREMDARILRERREKGRSAR